MKQSLMTSITFRQDPHTTYIALTAARNRLKGEKTAVELGLRETEGAGRGLVIFLALGVASWSVAGVASIG